MKKVISALAVSVAAGDSDLHHLQDDLAHLLDDIEELTHEHTPPAPAPRRAQAQAPAPASSILSSVAAAIGGAVGQVADNVERRLDDTPDCLEHDDYGDCTKFYVAPEPVKKPATPTKTHTVAGCSWTEYRSHDIGHNDLASLCPLRVTVENGEQKEKCMSKLAPVEKHLQGCMNQCLKNKHCQGFAYFIGGQSCELKTTNDAKEVFHAGGHHVVTLDTLSCHPANSGRRMSKEL